MPAYAEPEVGSSDRGLDALFSPRTIAVLGASPKPDKHGYRLVDNLRRLRRDVAIYPISQRPGPILGHESYRSIRDLPEPPDLLLVSIPARAVPDEIAVAASVGCKSAVVFACGFGEAGPEGRDLQERLLAVSRPVGLRVVGPNCMGICNLGDGLYGTYFVDLPDTAGAVGFVSQSGGFGGAAFKELYRLGVGISKFASIGNMSDVTHAELIRYLGADDDTRVVAAFVEGVPNGAELLDAIAEVSPVKPVVILKAGRTRAGQRAALSHTGALSTEGRLWEALLREAGAVVAEDSEDLFDSAASLAQCEHRLPTGPRAAIATVSGGPSVIAADACDHYGVELPDLDQDLADLRPLVPAFASLANPVDFSSQTPRENFGRAVGAVAGLDRVDGILAINVGFDAPEFADAFVDAWRHGEKPVVGYLVGDRIEGIFSAHGIPNLPTAERAVRALRRLRDRELALARARSRPDQPCLRFEPVATPPDGVLDEHAAKQLLAEHGLPVTRERVVFDAATAGAAAELIGYPVALKVLSAAIAHKTDVGGVILGIRDRDELARSVNLLTARFPNASLLVQEMVADGVELIVGGRRDPLAGPVIALGVGGVLVELIEDIAFARAPVTRARASELIGELRCQPLLDGFRGGPAVDRAALAELIERVGALLDANALITDLDLNPVIASAGRLVIADAVIRCESCDG